MSGNTTLTSHLYNGASGQPKEFCDFICRYERFHERLILTFGRTPVFRHSSLRVSLSKSLVRAVDVIIKTISPKIEALRPSQTKQRGSPMRITRHLSNSLASLRCSSG